MRLEFVTQPDATSTSLFEFLADLLSDSGITRFVAITAWVNHRGLSRLVPALRSFRARGGTAEVIVGIDEGGATEQGLRLAAAEFDRSSVFFTSDDRTFHPKLYFGSGTDRARLFVGSNNLTPGGLFYNFEAALVGEFASHRGGSSPDLALIASVNEFIERLYGDTDVCKPLFANLEEIVRNPAFHVRDEAQRRPRRGVSPIDPDADYDSMEQPPLFGRSARLMKPPLPPGDPIPPSTRAGTGALAQQEGSERGRRARGTGGRRTPRAGVAASRAVVGNVRRRWFRLLDATAAQHPPTPSSSPTGNLRLTQAGHGIDQTTYFRAEFFGRLSWTGMLTAQGTRETASVRMEVIIDGRSLGTRTFEVSHAGWREASQGNVTTVLHLAPIAAELRTTNYAGRVISLEERSPGGYRLVIDTVESGRFIR